MTLEHTTQAPYRDRMRTTVKNPHLRDTVRTANPLVIARLRAQGLQRVEALTAHHARLECGHCVHRTSVRVGRYTRCEFCAAALRDTQSALG